jgi:DNA repair protein RadA/Sms
MTEVSTAESEARRNSGIEFLDRVLGGPLPEGTVVLVAGEPGIGKSTLLFQMMAKQKDPVLYVSAEESEQQIAKRFRKLSPELSDQLYLISESRISEILQSIESLKPKVVVIDSIQMMISDNESFAKGGAANLREAADVLIQAAKAQNFTLWIIGHVTKEGEIAGPKTLEHLVDTVLVFSAAEDSRLRLLQSQKNRFGPSGELAVLEMDERGLTEKKDDAAFWIHKASAQVPGCALAPISFGSRILAVEIQALVVNSYFPSPRRSTSGFDLNRLLLLLAVLEKRLHIPFSRMDVYLNIVGGLKLSDPTADLAVAAALASAHSERALSAQCFLSAEVGLTGELRPVPSFSNRARYLQQSFKDSKLLTSASSQKSGGIKGFRIEGFETLDQALKAAEVL